MKNAPKYPRPQVSFESFSTIHAYSLKTHILGYVLVPGLTSNLYTISAFENLRFYQPSYEAIDRRFNFGRKAKLYVFQEKSHWSHDW